jgi:hypothetical protein
VESQLEKVKNKLNAGNWMRVRECSLCGESLHYLASNNHLFFQSHCGCVRYENYQPRPWDEINWYIENRDDLVISFLGEQ